jgi:hypothetical protein
MQPHRPSTLYKVCLASNNSAALSLFNCDDRFVKELGAEGRSVRQHVSKKAPHNRSCTRIDPRKKISQELRNAAYLSPLLSSYSRDIISPQKHSLPRNGIRRRRILFVVPYTLPFLRDDDLRLCFLRHHDPHSRTNDAADSQWRRNDGEFLRIRQPPSRTAIPSESFPPDAHFSPLRRAFLRALKGQSHSIFTRAVFMSAK